MIQVEHLTKYYGDHLAVKDVSFTITEGHVYGFLGPNGAGKSTTMNIITGCLSASEGRILIGGHDIFEEPNQAKRLIGYLPEHPPLYPGESPREYLRFVGEAKGLRGAQLREQIEEVMERTGLTGVRDRRIGQLSKGYQQRVGIAQALLGSPEVVILDEPTVGLDPIQIMEIRELIRELGKTHTVIFSSHILSEVQAICDRILMIAHGQLVAMGTPEELQQKLRTAGALHLTTNAPADAAKGILLALEPVEQAEAEADGQRTVVRVRAGQADLDALSAEVFRAFADAGYVLYELTVQKSSLEELFLELTETASAEEAEITPAAEAGEQEDAV